MRDSVARMENPDARAEIEAERAFLDALDGSCRTPIAALAMAPDTARVVLLVVWIGALAGVVLKLVWPHAPSWLAVPIYIALGWAAVFFVPSFFDGATRLGLGIGIATFVMIVVGGALYTFGGVVYGFKRPNPWPRWFGFHEVFHSLTILAFVSHYVGVSMATYALR